MIRPVIRPIVIASIASGIASKAMDEPGVSSEGMKYLRRLRDTADRLVERWPERLKSEKEMSDIEKHLKRFTIETHWDERPRNIQTYMGFICALMENAREKVLKNLSKVALVDAVLEAANAVWLYYSGIEREYEWCLQAGIRAAERWERIMMG